MDICINALESRYFQTFIEEQFRNSRSVYFSISGFKLGPDRSEPGKLGRSKMGEAIAK